MTQYFVKNEFDPIFEEGFTPKLLYICNVDDTYTRIPRTMHMHENILEIIFIKDGNGSHMIGGRHYHTNKGDILIYNNGVIHDEGQNSDAGMSVYCCGMTDVKLNGLPPNHLVNKEKPYVLHSGEYAKDIESLLMIMCTQITEGKHGAEEICSYLLRALISLILQIPQGNYTRSNSEEPQLLSEVKAYLDEHYHEDINLQLLSERFHISSYYLVHVFKKYTGFSPIQYIIRRRIGEAQSLLINSNESITKIAGMVGYDNTSYFTTLFSKTVGMSPKKYRQFWVENK